jgi:uncharacterized protein YjcR
METRDVAYKDYKKGMKYKDIAEKYGISLGTVKSWASRYWKKEKVATEQKGCNRNEHATKKPRGAPIGNKNALGKTGGAPVGNDNAVKHGGYSATMYWDTLTEEERSFADKFGDDAEQQLSEQIYLYSVRERRIMQAINKCIGIEGGLVVDSVSTTYTKRTFDSKEDKERYNDIREDKIAEGKISYLGYDRITQTTTDAAINKIIRLEKELTSVQRAKKEAIAELEKIRNARIQSESQRVDNKQEPNIIINVMAAQAGDADED